MVNIKFLTPDTSLFFTNFIVNKTSLILHIHNNNKIKKCMIRNNEITIRLS